MPHASIEDLARQLENEVERYSGLGRMNNLSDVALTMVSIVGSIAGAVVAASRLAPFWAAGCAALPAACTSYQRIVQLRERAFLHFEYAAQVEALALRLKTASAPDMAAFGQEWGEMITDRERRWMETLRAAQTFTDKRKTRKGYRPQI
jgi:hypothetical protein